MSNTLFFWSNLLLPRYYSLLSNFVSYENVGNPARDDPTRYQIIAENNAVPGKMFVAKIGSSTPAMFLSLVLTSRPTNLIEGVKTKSGDYVVRQLFATFQSGDVERIQGFCGMLVGSEAVRCNCIDRGDVKFSGSPDKIGHASSNVRSPSKNFWGRGQNVSSTSAQLVVRDGTFHTSPYGSNLKENSTCLQRSKHARTAERFG